MSKGRHTAVLLSRYGCSLWRGACEKYIYTRPSFYLCRSQPYSEQKSSLNDQRGRDIPKFPWGFGTGLKIFWGKKFEQAVRSAGIESSLPALLPACEEILEWTAVNLARKDIESLRTRLTPEAINQAQSYMDSLDEEDRSALLTPRQYKIFIPWHCEGSRDVEITLFFALSRPFIFGASILIPEDSESSEDWKVTHLHMDKWSFY